MRIDRLNFDCWPSYSIQSASAKFWPLCLPQLCDSRSGSGVSDYHRLSASVCWPVAWPYAPPIRAESPISCEGVLQELVDDHLRHCQVRSRSQFGKQKPTAEALEINTTQWHPVTMAISSAAKWRQVRSRKPMHTRQVEFQILGPASITKWGTPFSDRAPNLQESLPQTPSLSRNQVECIRPPSRRAYIKDISIHIIYALHLFPNQKAATSWKHSQLSLYIASTIPWSVRTLLFQVTSTLVPESHKQENHGHSQPGPILPTQWEI